jgi:anti-sigma regulatory factor (Ser/Thr protein kinase)
MAFPTAVNSQITDSVSQANTEVLGNAPSVATGNFMIATSEAMSNAVHNATSNQQNAGITAQAALTQGISTLDGIDTTTAAAKDAAAIYD